MTDVLKIPEAAKALGVAMPETLWNSEDCATFFRRSVDRFLTDIRSLPDFPPPIILPTGKARQSRPLWEPCSNVSCNHGWQATTRP